MSLESDAPCTPGNNVPPTEDALAGYRLSTPSPGPNENIHVASDVPPIKILPPGPQPDPDWQDGPGGLGRDGFLPGSHIGESGRGDTWGHPSHNPFGQGYSGK
jgi:hypothetical protein